MTEDYWLYLLMVVVVAICIYELFTGNLTRWSERGAVKNITEYCNLVCSGIAIFTTDEFPLRNCPPRDPFVKERLTSSGLRISLLPLSPKVYRAIMDLNPASAYVTTDGSIVVVYKYNRIILRTYRE